MVCLMIIFIPLTCLLRKEKSDFDHGVWKSLKGLDFRRSPVSDLFCFQIILVFIMATLHEGILNYTNQINSKLYLSKNNQFKKVIKVIK